MGFRQRSPLRLSTEFIFNYLSALDCPRSLAVWLLFKSNEHQQLAMLECDPLHFNDPQQFKDAYSATEFLSKATFLKTGFDLKGEAMKKFWSAERSCNEVNKDRDFVSLRNSSEAFDTFHKEMRRKISRVLRDFNPEEWLEGCDWGPGSTSRLGKRVATREEKFRIESGITLDCHDLVKDWFSLAYPSWDTVKWDFQPGNKVITVPKNAKTDRTIAKEPGINLWFQKGMGSLIRRRLRGAGIDLNSGQDRHGILSHRGSLYGDLATIDFRNASASISVNTVRSLLPERWFRVLDALRSKFAIVDGRVHEYSQFSSMGNGFTFELETLIFYAMAVVSCRLLKISGPISVYGDDVIMPTGAVDLFVSMATHYGFEINPKKTFSSGWFRESCGYHWYKGLCCKPLYLRRLIDGQAQTFLMANQLRRYAYRAGFNSCDKRFLQGWRRLRISLPAHKCFMIPEGYGDGGFVVNFDESHATYAAADKRYKGFEGFVTRHLSTRPLGRDFDHRGVLLERISGHTADDPDVFRLSVSRGLQYYLSCLISRNTEKGNSTFTGITKYRVSRLLVPTWPDLGPWT